MTTPAKPKVIDAEFIEVEAPRASRDSAEQKAARVVTAAKRVGAAAGDALEAINDLFSSLPIDGRGDPPSR